MFALGLALTVVVAFWAAILLAFTAPLSARWREPVFCEPILILESDDWGAGPPEQAEALDRIAAVLERIRDVTERRAVLTLGVVFEVPDGERIVAEGFGTYYGVKLSDKRFEGVRTAMLRGVARGVFAPQLHQMCC